jgi:hypothetical protein
MYAREEGRGVCIGGASDESEGVSVGEGGKGWVETFASMKIGVGPPSQVTVSALSRVVIMMLAGRMQRLSAERLAGRCIAPETEEGGEE